MKIKAKYKGRDKVLGYRNGSNYVLEFETVKHPFTVDLHECILVTPSADTREVWRRVIAEDEDEVTVTTAQPCAYESLKAFLNNWQVFK